MSIDGPAVHKSVCGVLRQWMPAAKGTTTDTFLGILKGFEGSGSGTPTRCRVCLQDA